MARLAPLVTFDALLLFWGITMLVTISFTVMAQAAARQSPDVVALLREGDREAALEAMSGSFASVGLPALGTVFLCFIALIGLNATLGLLMICGGAFGGTAYTVRIRRSPDGGVRRALFDRRS